MTRYWIPGIDEAYFLTRPEYAKLLGISNNALRMKMRRGFFGEEYVIKNGKYVFKRPSPNIDKRPGDKTDIYQSVKAQNYKYKKNIQVTLLTAWRDNSFRMNQLLLD